MKEIALILLLLALFGIGFYAGYLFASHKQKPKAAIDIEPAPGVLIPSPRPGSPRALEIDVSEPTGTDTPTEDGWPDKRHTIG